MYGSEVVVFRKFDQVVKYDGPAFIGIEVFASKQHAELVALKIIETHPHLDVWLYSNVQCHHKDITDPYPMVHGDQSDDIQAEDDNAIATSKSNYDKGGDGIPDQEQEQMLRTAYDLVAKVAESADDVLFMRCMSILHEFPARV